jgi:hypothetical protein
MRLLEPMTDRLEAGMLVALGDRDAAIGLLRRALSSFEDMGIAVEAATAREHLAALVDESERRSLLESALETYEATGARRRAQRVRGPFRGRD